MEQEKPLDPSYMDFLDLAEKNHNMRFNTKDNTEHNLEYDLLTTDWILKKVRDNKHYAQHLYAALCNNVFQKLTVVTILKNTTWSASCRYAGGIIADMRQEGDYIDWYLSGMSNDLDDSLTVADGFVTEEIKNDLKTLGWIVVTED